MADAPQVRLIDSGFLPPRREMEGDLPGYKPKPKLEKSPYVKDRFGFIWHWQPWMEDMGDVLEPCWEAPPKAKLVVPVGIELERYAQHVRSRPEQPQAQAEQRAAPPAENPPAPQKEIEVRGRRKAKASA
jgi:hypothetical protein